MSHQKKHARLIHEVSTVRFKGGPSLLIDEKDLPLPVQEKLRGLRQELRLMNDALAQRNLELYEARRELRVIHRALGTSKLHLLGEKDAVLKAIQAAKESE